MFDEFFKYNNSEIHLRLKISKIPIKLSSKLILKPKKLLFDLHKKTLALKHKKSRQPSATFPCSILISAHSHAANSRDLNHFQCSSQF